MFKKVITIIGEKIIDLRFWLAGKIMPGDKAGFSNHYNDFECDAVREMFDKFGFKHRDLSPGPMPAQQLLERVECMWEEFLEFLTAAGVAVERDAENNRWAFYKVNPSQDIPQMADALVDLCYFLKGTAVAMGLPWGHLFVDVHLCNMDKVLGTTKRGHKIDLAKPAGWEPPRTADILIEHGWDGGEDALSDVGR